MEIVARRLRLSSESGCVDRFVEWDDTPPPVSSDNVPLIETLLRKALAFLGFLDFFVLDGCA